MGINQILTPDDLKAGDLAEPGWAPAVISKYEEAVVKGTPEKPSDGSINGILSFKVEDGPNKGLEMKRYLNEKALGFGKGIYEAVGLKKNAAGGYDITTEVFQKMVGSKLEVYIKRGKNKDTNKEFNELADFRPAKK